MSMSDVVFEVTNKTDFDIMYGRFNKTSMVENILSWYSSNLENHDRHDLSIKLNWLGFWYRVDPTLFAKHLQFYSENIITVVLSDLIPRTYSQLVNAELKIIREG